MADCAALELLCAGNGTGGSNPPLSALLIGSHRKPMAPFFLALSREPHSSSPAISSVQACLLNSAPARFEIVVQAYVPVPRIQPFPQGAASATVRMTKVNLVELGSINELRPLSSSRREETMFGRGTYFPVSMCVPFLLSLRPFLFSTLNRRPSVSIAIAFLPSAHRATTRCS